jgi:hypothetical protein
MRRTPDPSRVLARRLRRNTRCDYVRFRDSMQKVFHFIRVAIIMARIQFSFGE